MVDVTSDRASALVVMITVNTTTTAATTTTTTAARIGPDCRYMPDLTSRIRFGSVFSKKAWIILCKTGPGPIWMAWSGCPEASRCARIIGPGSGRTQPARYQFPTFRLGCVLPQTAWAILCKKRKEEKKPGSSLVLTDCARF